MSIHLSKEESIFRNDLLFCPDYKTIDLDHTLTNLFMQIRHEGRRVKTAFKGEYTLETIVAYMKNLEKEDAFAGVDEFQDMVKTWVRCNLTNLAFRGNHAKEKFSSLRPLHLETFLIRNVKHNRDYFTSDQLYYMLRTQPKILELLSKYLGKGYDRISHELQNNPGLDIDTVALLHLVKKLRTDIRSQIQIRIIKPFLEKQAGLYAEDILRLLSYQDEIPRNVMMEYLRILSGFHLALYFYKLIYLLPKMIQAGTRNVTDDWSMVLDVSGLLESSMSKIACQDLGYQLNGLNAYIRSTFAFNAVRSRVKNGTPTKQDDVDYILDLIKNPPEDANVYFEWQLKNIYDRFTEDEEDERIELQKYLQYEPDNFAKYVSLLQKERGQYQYGFGLRFIDSVSMKNSESALVIGGRSRKHSRRGVLGSKLLELLVQLLVLTPRENGGGFETQSLSVSELIEQIRKRYGLVIDGSCEKRFSDTDVQTHLAFRDNVNALKNKLRQIGFYTDLSDAGSLQKIRPRYQVKSC